jgi:protein-disulfide isomerase
MVAHIRRTDVVWAFGALLAILVTASAARRVSQRPVRPEMRSEPRIIEAAARFAAAGIVVGDSMAPVKIVEFADFECRFCRRLHATLDRVRARQANAVAIVFRHYPLSRFGSSHPAAVAAECAAAEGRFEEFAALLFASQDSLSRLSLGATALRAGVVDTARFHNCIGGSVALARVAEDVTAGRQLGLTATPALLVGDQMIVGDVSLETLEAMIETLRRRQMGR